MSEKFKTIESVSTAEYRDRGSLFIATAFPCMSIEEAKEILLSQKKTHPKANHHCYAWRIGTDKNVFRKSDDGEPSGTAGKPILAQIDAANLTNIIVVVVRYFGGVLLGTGGLINAYRTSTSDALLAATVIEKMVPDQFRIEAGTSMIYEILKWLKSEKTHIKKFEVSLFSVIECDADELLIQKMEQRFSKAGLVKVTRL